MRARPALPIFFLISVLFSLEAKIVGCFRGTEAAGVSDPKDSRKEKQPFEAGMKFMVKLQIRFP